MHSNNTQVQVQIPAAYYSPLGSVALNANLSFSGGGSHHSVDHDHAPSSHVSGTTSASLNPYHTNHGNGFSAQFHHHSSQQQSHHHHHTDQQDQHNQQQSQQHQQTYSSSSQQSHNTNNSHGYHADFQKSIPVQHQVDIYQPPHQALDSELMNPIVNRQLNHQYASNYHSPYNYHQHYSSQNPSYHSSSKQPTLHHQEQSSPQQQQSQLPDHTSDQQQRSNASTPTPTLTSTLSTVSSASTPSLSSNTATLPSSHDFFNGGSTGHGNDRHASPVSSTPTPTSFQAPSSPEQMTVSSQLPGTLNSQNTNLAQPLSAWTTAGHASDQELLSQPSMSPSREHGSFSCVPSPKNDRPTLSHYSPQAASHLYSDHHPSQQTQVWVGSMPSESFHAQQEMSGQGRHPHPPHHQRSYSQSSRNSAQSHAVEPSVASQHSGMSSMGGIPLLSPASMLQSEYPSSYSVNMHEAPTIMSHLDYGRVNSTIPSSGDSNSRYGGPIRTSHNKSRTTSVGSQREFSTRTRASSINSTSSSIASSGVVTTLTSTFGSTSIGHVQQSQDEDEDSDSPTTIQMRPRTNTAPRKAVAARVFECSMPGCSKAYTQLHNLKSHERTGHTPVIKLKPFHCIIEGCSKAFSQRKSLALHIKTAHADFKFKPFKCSQGGCSKSYTQLHNLRTHEKTVHLVDLSRKRIKNPAVNGSTMPTPSSLSPPFSSLDGKTASTSMPYHSMDNPHGLGLGYSLNDLDLGAGVHGEDPYHYSRQHAPHLPPQPQHHPQAYARLPHLNPLPSMYDHRS